MMYQIEYMGQMVYAPDVKHCILEPKLDIELNSAGTLTFTVPVENEYLWNNIEVFKGEVRVYEDDDIIWFGRPLQIVRNWKNQKVVTCEGALAYFNDSLQATHTYEKIPLYTSPDYQPGKEGFFNTIIGLHNDQVRISEQDHSHEFVVGNVDVQNEVNIYRQVDYQTTAEVLQQMCLDTTGGYFILRKEKEGENFVTYIDWYKQVPYGTDQDIQFGLNLLDLNQDLNGSDICTVVLAFGKDDKTVAGLSKYDEQHPYVMPSGSFIYHNGEYIFHKTAYEKYGRVVKVKNWSDMSAVGADNKEQLFIKAAEWLEDQNTDTTTIECSAADLHYLKQYAKKGKLRIGQLVHVTSSIHGLEDKVLPIYKISMSLDSGAKTITMGTPPKRELTDIVKPSGGSTRGSSGATGGGGSGSGSGGGGSSSVPVKDVMVKYPGDEDFHTAVNKKVAKIDLTDISGGVKDVRIDGNSIVDNHGVANIDSDQFGTDVEANPEGASSGDLSSIGIDGVKYNIPTVANIVEDVTLDGVSIKDPNDNVAKILSRDIIEGGIEGNFEHVVTKDNNFPSGHPSKTVGKKTDILIETNIDDAEVSILSNTDMPINLEEIGGWVTYEQDFVAQPTGYYDPNDLDPEGNPKWKYDPTSPTRFRSTITCNGTHSASWWFANVEGEIRPFTGHTGTIQTYGYKINNGGYPEITFEKHDPNIKYKPTRVVGIFNFECMHAGDSAHGPEESDRCNSSIIRIHVSNDGENWTVFEPISAPEDGNGTFEFGIDEYYSYVRMICKNFLYQGPGYSSFNVYAVPESYIENIWFKTENEAWIKQHIPKIKPNSQGTSVGALTSITIDGDKYDIPAGHLDGIVSPDPSIGNDGDEYFKLSGAISILRIVSLKFKVTARKGGGNDMIQYSQLGFYDKNDNKFSWPAETTWSDDVGHYENDPIAIDGKLLLVSIPGTVTINLPSGSYIDSSIYTKFGWFTANDSSDRDPISWELYVSENGTDYVLVDTRSQQSIPDQRLVSAFKDDYASGDIPVIKDIYYKKYGRWLKDDFGSTIVPNPETQPTERLNTVQIGETTYKVSSGGGDPNEVDFYYTGDIQTFTAPENGTYKLEVWGAQGGAGSTAVHGGYGGYSVGYVELNEGDTIYICVGGKGGGSATSDTTVAGYNGGGLANFGGSRGNGGGATHIAKVTGLLNTLENNLSDILIVAGGGGGAGYYTGSDSGNGGSGGGYTGGHGLYVGSPTGDSNSHTGSGGTQSNGGETEDYSQQSTGSFGQGANRDDNSLWGGSAGGGGLYGGGASTNNAGAGGGSGYINTSVLTDAAMYGYDIQTSEAESTKTYSVNRSSEDPTSQLAKEGDGHAKITYGGGEFDPYVSVGDLYDACVANNVTPVSKSLVDIVAALLNGRQ